MDLIGIQILGSGFFFTGVYCIYRAWGMAS